MQRDHQTMFSDNQRVCNAGAAEESTNVYDFGVAAAKPRAGNPRPKILFTVKEVFAGTATTLTITIQESSDNGVTDAFANIAGCTTGAIAKAALVAGHTFEMDLPESCERYIRLLYTGDNTFETTGIMDAEMMLDRQTNKGGY